MAEQELSPEGEAIAAYGAATIAWSFACKATAPLSTGNIRSSFGFSWRLRKATAAT
jgi:hypothetical protein